MEETPLALELVIHQAIVESGLGVPGSAMGLAELVAGRIREKYSLRIAFTDEERAWYEWLIGSYVDGLRRFVPGNPHESTIFRALEGIDELVREALAR